MKTILKILFFLTIIVGNISILNAQSTTWQKVLSYTNNSGLLKAHQTRDGGFIAAGVSGVGVYGKIFIVKFNNFGDTLWNKYFDLSVNAVYSSLWIEETLDRGFIIAGTGEGINSDAYLIKSDSLGNIQWYKTFGGPDLDQGVCVKQLSDNKFIFLVRTVSYSSTNDILMIKTDSIGNEMWRKIYGNSTYQERGYEVQPVGNSGFIIVGRKNITNNPSNLYLIKTDPNGDSLWTKTYSFYNSSTGFSIDTTNDHGFIICGIADSTNNNYPLGYVVKTDFLGNIEWQKRYSSAYKEFCFSIRTLPNNRYAFCGMSDSSFFNYERAILRTIDGVGNILREKYYRGGVSENAFQSVELTNDHGFILCGYADFGVAKSYIVKTDSLGKVSPVGIKNYQEVAKEFELYQNYPNPFNPVTNLEFGISKLGFVTLKVYDLLGKEIATIVNENLSPGTYRYKFDGSNFASGVYFYKLVVSLSNSLVSGSAREAGDFVAVKRMVLVK